MSYVNSEDTAINSAEPAHDVLQKVAAAGMMHRTPHGSTWRWARQHIQADSPELVTAMKSISTIRMAPPLPSR